MNHFVRALSPASQRPIDDLPIAAMAEAPRRRRLHLWLILLFWASHFGFLTLNLRLSDLADELPTIPWPRMVMTLAGIALSIGISASISRFAGRTWSRRILLVLLATCGAGLLHVAANIAMWTWLFPGPSGGFTPRLTPYISAWMQWLWIYGSMAGLLLCATYRDEIRDRERRLGELQALAHATQLRSLRYQLNPHFIFNTLNSVASLISAGERARAEHMVENLSDFLRAGLAIDPSDDLTLEDELALQSLYLSIEAERFADRMRIETELPDELRDVLVPSLILQPAIENAIKHGVARSEQPNRLEIKAAREGDRLVVRIANDIGSTSARPGRGTGVGLVNVARRLELRYGDKAEFHAGLESGSRFVARLVLPIRRAGA